MHLPFPIRKLLVVLPLALPLLLPIGSSASQTAAVRLQSIVLDPAALTLIPGATQAVHARGLYSDGSSRDLTGAVVFRSRATDVATVDAAGLVTGVAAGRADINATEPQSGVTSKNPSKVAVAKLKSIAVTPATFSLRAGGQTTVQALGTYDDGTTGVDLTAELQWSSAKSSVAKVSVAAGVVTVQGVASGTTNVLAVDPATGIKSDHNTGLVTVLGRLVRVTVSPAKKVLRVDERSRFKAIGTFEKDGTLDISGDVDWSSGDPTVATIDALGRVQGVAVGATTIRATDHASKIASTASAGDGALSVVGDVTSLRVSPANTILALSGKGQLKATASFAGQADTANFTSKVDWVSSDPSRVSVDRSGAVTCLAAGTVLVSARDPLTGVTSTATGGDGQVLCGLALQGLTVVPSAVKLGPGKTKKAKAYLVFEGGAQVDVSKQVQWKSSNPKLVTVGTVDPNIGLMTAVSDGIATVSARDPATGVSSDDPGGTSCVVTVQGQPVSIQIEPDPTGKGTLSVNVGESLKLKVLAKFVGGSTRGLDAFVTWESSAPQIVKVSNGDDGDRPGTAHFLAPGTATITITYPKDGTPLPPGATPLSDTAVITVH